MSHSIYRFFVGVLLLIFLYFELDAFMAGLIAVLILEAMTPLNIPQFATQLLGKLRLSHKFLTPSSGSDACPMVTFTSERMMSLLVGLMLGVSYFWLNDVLWFLPWFLVLALIGSGASGFCPMLIALRRLGFK